MESYGIDGHKLIYHPKRVAQWCDTMGNWEAVQNIYPLYLELSPFGACNHRCTFCALDYMGYVPNALDLEVMRERLPEMAALGIKSLMFAGEGEPLLAKGLSEMAKSAFQAGMDISLTSNGVKMDEAFLDTALGCFSWIKISLNAGHPETYAKIHRTDPKDFRRVIANLQSATQVRSKQSLPCTLGVQLLLLPENVDEVETLAIICRDEIGVDYLVIKPHSQHFFSHAKNYNKLHYSGIENLEDRLSALTTPAFQVIFRKLAFERRQQEKPYSRCLATPFFWGYISSSGDVYSCSAFLGDARFCLGNIHSQSFQEIWQGEGRRKNYELMTQTLDPSSCRLNCRMDAVNQYLWALTHPHPHVNFI